jgi:putative membrane protein
MKFATMAAVAALLGASLAACGPRAETTTTETASTAPVEAPAPVPEVAQDFLNKAANTDMLEIETSKVALVKSKNADVKALAKMIIADHTKTTQQAKDFVAKNTALMLPAAADSDFQMRIDNIKNADATGFDDKYLDTVIDAHEAGISTFESYVANGDNADLKTWAAATLPTLQAHFEKAKTIREALNKS